MNGTLLLIAAAAIGGLAFFARTAVLLGREPGGVDAWYYLCYARAFRKQPALRVRLPQYLLQDEEQSYAPVFPSLLALLPERVLSRGFWAIAPAIDCVTLVLLFLLALRLTGSATVALVAGLVYGLSPALVSETRSLSPRSFGVLLHALSVVLLLRSVLGAPNWMWTAAAVVSGAVLVLSSATAMASYVLVTTCLALYFFEPRYFLLALSAFALAWIVSLGHLGRVLLNYVHAVRYWTRNRRIVGSHPILDSPVYGGPRQRATTGPRDLGFLGSGLGPQLLRLVGENPFLLVLPLVTLSPGRWSEGLFIWAAALSGFAILATIVWPLRAFGPGRNYMRSAVFPSAYLLASAIGTPAGLLRPVGLATLAALAASAASIAFFFFYMRNKRNEWTAHVPPGLRTLVDHMSSLPAGGVVCLPGGYSDYVTHQTERPVLWGSHSGSLDKFELVAPVWRERVEEAARRLGVRYLIVERAWVDPAVLALDSNCGLIEKSEGFDLFDLQATPAKP